MPCWQFVTHMEVSRSKRAAAVLVKSVHSGRSGGTVTESAFYCKLEQVLQFLTRAIYLNPLQVLMKTIHSGSSNTFPSYIQFLGPYNIHRKRHTQSNK